MAHVRDGLERVPSLLPGRGYLEGIVGVSTRTGPVARIELGYRPREKLSLFGFGQWTPRESVAGIGAGLKF